MMMYYPLCGYNAYKFHLMYKQTHKLIVAYERCGCCLLMACQKSSLKAKANTRSTSVG